MGSDTNDNVQILVDRPTADALAAQAAARGLSLGAYLRTLADIPPAGGNGSVDMAEFDRWLDDLSDGAPAAPSLPADFGRADVYADHD